MAERMGPEALYRTGKKLHRAGKYEEAREWYEKAAALGHPIAAEMLNVPPPQPAPASADPLGRLRWEALARTIGGEAGEELLRQTPYAPEEIPVPEVPEAPEVRDTGEAQYQEGLALSRANDPGARPLFEQAALLGHPKAQFSLARLCDREGNREQALEWYRKAAAQGHEMARATLFRIDPAPQKYIITDISPEGPDLL